MAKHLNPEQIDLLTHMIQAGKPTGEVIKAVGCSDATYYGWRKRIEKGMKKKVNGANGHAPQGNPLENAIIKAVRNRLGTDPIFAETLLSCLSAES